MKNKKNLGITLIALVITVIVMLILAGVSLNALVGDNGIITNSVDAKMRTGIAILEEYLQQKYVENFKQFVNGDNKVAKLANLYQEYFYDPRDDNIGTVNYILDSEGHALYLINKSGLPQEVQDNLTGGYGGEGLTGTNRYDAYSSLKDVYGVTSGLEVWYSDGSGTFYGLNSTDDLDKDRTDRVLLDASNPLADLIKKDGTDLTVADVRKVGTLTLDEDSEVASFRDFYVLPSLRQLVIKNKNFESLEGIGRITALEDIAFSGCEIGDYSDLANVKNLSSLVFYNIDDDELSTICSGIKNASFSKLKQFCIWASESGLNVDTFATAGARKTGTKYITNLLPVGELSSTCIGNVETFFVAANEITDTVDKSGATKYALENISLMTNLKNLRVERNKLTTLKGLENMNQLYNIMATYNNLGIDEIYDATASITHDDPDIDRGKDSTKDALASLQGKTSIYNIALEGNVNLKWVGYISGCTGLKRLTFGNGTNATDCLNMVDSEVSKIKNVYYGATERKSLPGKYWMSLLSSTDTDLEINLSGASITLSQFNGLTDYPNVKYLNMSEVKIYTNYDDATQTYSGLINDQSSINTYVNGTLKYLKNLKYLNLNSKSSTSLYNLTDITFIKGEEEDDASDDINLIELNVYGTKVSTHKLVAGTPTPYNNGLILLNTKKDSTDNNSPYYCDDLKVLMINDSYTDLGLISDVVRRCCYQDTNSYFLVYASAYPR